MEVECQVRECQVILDILTRGELEEPTIVEVILEASSQPLHNKTFHKIIQVNLEDPVVQEECILVILVTLGLRT